MSTKNPSDDILDLVHGVMHQYRALQYRFLRDGPYPITHMDGRVLNFFGEHPGATQKDLAQHLGRDKAQLARLVKGLRDLGLIMAQADEQDGRSVKLSLSTEGDVVRLELRRRATSLGERAVDGLSSAERAQLSNLLQRVSANLAAAEE
jgi:DNA-binding MarR family transcriptional regulator